MTFRDITNKNLKYNIRNFASFFLVNTFVVCVLFLFGSLMFNDILNNDAAIRAAGSLIVMAAVGVTIFSVIFLVYTGNYFIRSRGKEFGVYLTLGMTSCDLLRMAAVEGTVIFGAASALGIAAALLIGKLFYLALAKVLGVTDNLFFIGYETFLFSLGILAFTFAIQRWSASQFIRKLSIVEIIKSTKTKGAAKQRPIVGIASTVVFVLALFMFRAVATGADWAINLLHGYMEAVTYLLVAIMIASMFFLIGSAVAGATWICKRFPALYQRNILLLSGLSYKFRAYRVSLFSVTLLVAFAVFFIGIGMSLYIYGEMTIDTFQPHGFMIEQRGDINNVNESELREIVRAGGGEIECTNTMPYLDGLIYRELHERNGLFISFRQNAFLVGESDFNRFTGLNISIEPDELLVVTNDVAAEKEGAAFDTIIVVEPFVRGIARAQAFRNDSPDKSTFLQTLSDADVLEYQQDKTSILFLPFVNSHGSLEFIRSHANVIDDDVYNLLSVSQSNKLITFELATGEPSKVMDALLAALMIKNNIPDGAWQDAAEFTINDKDNIDGLRPLSKTERHEILLRANGFLLFAMAFLGLLFLASSCIVLYYKLAVDTDEEAKNIAIFKKIGLTVQECRKYLQTHIAIIFFLPLLLGGSLGLYLTYQFVSITSYPSFLVSRVAMMYGGVMVFGIWLYAALRKRFFKDVRL